MSKKNPTFCRYIFTAGYPNLNDTRQIITELEAAGTDLIEIGMPFSDSVVDGTAIQASNKKSLENGFTLELLFEQLAGIRALSSIPLVYMGYVNQLMQFGIEKFCKKCEEVGIDGLIIPDLPLGFYRRKYQKPMQAAGLYNIRLVGPQSTDERILELDAASEGFLYAVSSSATTGGKSGFGAAQIDYLDRLGRLKLKSPIMVGFGISNAETFRTACSRSRGAIIGSAFVRAIAQPGDLSENIRNFVAEIRDTQKV